MVHSRSGRQGPEMRIRVPLRKLGQFSGGKFRLMPTAFGWLAICILALLPCFLDQDARAQDPKQSLPGTILTTGARETEDPEKARSLAVIHKAVRKLEREMADAKDDVEQARLVASMCALFVEIGEHPQIPSSPTLQSLSVRLRTRLRGWEHRIIDELKRRDIAQPAEMVEQERRRRLSRTATPSGRTAGDGLAARHPSQSDSHAFQSPFGRHGREASSDTHALEGPGGGSSMPAGSAGGHAAPGPDFGWALVNLIRHTIRPDYWSVAGGPGKALYFRNSRALVIHGSWTVHEEVAELLTALRSH